MRTLEDRLAASYSQARLFAYLVSTYALLAALLAGAGLYGVLAGALASRTREIGLRVALGASRTRVARLVLVDTGLVIAAGLLLGMCGALALSRTLDELLFGVGARDPSTFAGVCIAIGIVGLLASAVPLRRALAVEPMVALRHE
jgi:putative ABC transport system permease protein